MLIHPRSTLRVLCRLMRLRSGHVTLPGAEFLPPVGLTAPGGLTLGSAPNDLPRMQFIAECNSERVIKIGSHLPKKMKVATFMARGVYTWRRVVSQARRTLLRAYVYVVICYIHLLAIIC